MFKYIIKDMAATGCYLPYVIVLLILVGLLIGGINSWRIHKGKTGIAVIPMTLLVTYGLVVLLITFLSREDSGSSGMYLELFSSWGINARNNAYFIENILLFMPLGFFYGWVMKAEGSSITGLLLGLSFSFCIESLQFVTGRGVFQVDDILTNGLGMFAGAILFKLGSWVCRRRNRR